MGGRLAGREGMRQGTVQTRPRRVTQSLVSLPTVEADVRPARAAIPERDRCSGTDFAGTQPRAPRGRSTLRRAPHRR